MSRFSLITRTVFLLGLRNVSRVAIYKLRLKLGWRPRPLQFGCPDGNFFNFSGEGKGQCAKPSPLALKVFGWCEVPISSPPDWHTDCTGQGPRSDPDQDWSEALASLSTVDVKSYWELSRFYWLPHFALAASVGDKNAAVTIEHWLRDWINKNPPFRGINWACGQEAAIRLMNLSLSAIILEDWRTPFPALRWMVETHAQRIYPTLSYAIGQDNNHGTAEACALFIAGTWGQMWAMHGASKFAWAGRKWVNNRALRMIQHDGSPCQYSTTYHRANLESFCMVGLWSKRTGAQCLNADSQARVVEGARWLYEITDPSTGDAPNLGANDGSNLFCLPQTGYRDFRPTVALAAALFANVKPWIDFTDSRLKELRITPGKNTWISATSRHFANGGFHVLRRDKSFALMHYPQFRFRPSQADALHVDLWHNGHNLLRDAGTYCYNSSSTDWFAGTSAHNTIGFDGRDQMPRVGRFLFGGWLKADAIEPVYDDGVNVKSAAAYTDYRGARHHRSISLSDGSFICHDTITGNFEEACLRWRLAPGDFHVDGNIVKGEIYSVTIEFNGLPIVPVLATSVESRYYRQKIEIPEISVKVERPGTFVTKVTF